MNRLLTICCTMFFLYPLSGISQENTVNLDTVTYIADGDTMRITPAAMDSMMREQEDVTDTDTARVSSPKEPVPEDSRGFRYQYGFRNVPWGSDIATAKRYLNHAKFDREDPDALAWYDTIAEDSVYVRLYFYRDQFWQASFTYLLGDHAGIQDYSKKFQRIEEVLVKKYGNPDKMRRITWDDSPYIGEVDAIAMGQGLFQSRWFFEEKSSGTSVTMDLLLQGINFRPNLVLQYSKPAIIKEIEKVEEDTLIQYY